MAALWLTALCPFTANYVAVPLTETLATFFTTLTILFLCLLLLRFRGSIFWVEDRSINLYFKEQWFAAFAGVSAGFGTLIRPETPLLLMTSCVVLAWYFLRGGQWSSQRSNQWRKTIRIFAFMAAGCCTSAYAVGHTQRHYLA